LLLARSVSPVRSGQAPRARRRPPASRSSRCAYAPTLRSPRPSGGRPLAPRPEQSASAASTTGWQHIRRSTASASAASTRGLARIAWRRNPPRVRTRARGLAEEAGRPWLAGACGGTLDPYRRRGSAPFSKRSGQSRVRAARVLIAAAEPTRRLPPTRGPLLLQAPSDHSGFSSRWLVLVQGSHPAEHCEVSVQLSNDARRPAPALGSLPLSVRPRHEPRLCSRVITAAPSGSTARSLSTGDAPAVLARRDVAPATKRSPVGGRGGCPARTAGRGHVGVVAGAPGYGVRRPALAEMTGAGR